MWAPLFVFYNIFVLASFSINKAVRDLSFTGLSSARLRKNGFVGGEQGSALECGASEKLGLDSPTVSCVCVCVFFFLLPLKNTMPHYVYIQVQS